jgi:hypothetical protein
MELEAGYRTIPVREKRGVTLAWKDINYFVEKKIKDGSIQSRTLLSKMSGV